MYCGISLWEGGWWLRSESCDLRIGMGLNENELKELGYCMKIVDKGAFHSLYRCFRMKNVIFLVVF